MGCKLCERIACRKGRTSRQHLPQQAAERIEIGMDRRLLTRPNPFGGHAIEGFGRSLGVQRDIRP